MLAAWGPHSALCRAGGQVAQARFLDGGGLGVPMPFAAQCPEFAAGSLKWIVACERAQFIGRRLVCSVLVLLRVCNVVGLQAECVWKRHVHVVNS